MARRQSFIAKKRVGDVAEKAVNNLFLSCGFKSSISKRKTITHDITTTVPQHSLGFTTEVKFDEMEAATGNVAVEIHNTSLNKPSGIYATQAFFWCFVLKNGEVWLTLSDTLRRYISEYKPVRTVENCGDGNATVLLYNSSVILPKIFVRIDRLEPQDLAKYVIRKLQDG